MRTLFAHAPAKINLCLYVGPTRADGRHELASVMDTLDLADDLHLDAAPPGAESDEVVCPGVEGPNLAAAALAAFRARTGWDAPPVRLSIVKRIPVAGGMAGGSADAAAALRLAAASADVDDAGLLEEVAAGLGADVPSQVRGGRVLAGGAGERLRPLPGGRPYRVLALPVEARLSAAAVYAEADRLGLTRDAQGLAERRAAVVEAEAAGGVLAAGLAANDLQDAARSLCPAIDAALDAARAAGADRALVCGSGPTVVGLFAQGDADAGLRALAGRRPAVVAAAPEAASPGLRRWPR